MSACVATRTTHSGFLIFPPKAVDTTERQFYCLFLTYLIIMHNLSSQINSKISENHRAKLDSQIKTDAQTLFWHYPQHYGCACYNTYTNSSTIITTVKAKASQAEITRESLRETRMRKLQTALMKHTEWRTVKHRDTQRTKLHA